MSKKGKAQPPSLPKNYGTQKWFSEVEDRVFSEMVNKQPPKEDDMLMTPSWKKAEAQRLDAVSKQPPTTQEALIAQSKKKLGR